MATDQSMTATVGLPEGLLLTYYGDDFTGSTDAMEVMAAAGLPTVLFLGAPQHAMLQRFAGVRCVGIAGSSRGRSPAWMDAELPTAFAQLASLRAPVLQYKVCSTFDSSAQTGSIGHAIDLGLRQMPADTGWSPMIVGAPRLQRYQLFGTLFAAADGRGYRLDRHPTMSRHPVTPMHEADLRCHLAQQTARRIELIDMVQLRAGTASAEQNRHRGSDTPVLLIDVLDDETLCEAGRLVWEQRGSGVFTASSSGLQYALTRYWRARGWIAPAAALPTAGPVPVIAAVSGSCSPVTAGQIAWARTHGFALERLDLSAALDVASHETELTRIVTRALQALAQGRSPLVYSAEGPDDPCVLGFDAIAQQAGLERSDAARRIGAALAEIMRRVLDASPVTRLAIAGGDSSGEVATALDIAALSVCAALSPGAPLCRAWSDNPRRDGLQVVLKGGQMGTRSFFGDVLEGKSLSAS